VDAADAYRQVSFVVFVSGSQANQTAGHPGALESGQTQHTCAMIGLSDANGVRLSSSNCRILKPGFVLRLEAVHSHAVRMPVSVHAALLSQPQVEDILHWEPPGVPRQQPDGGLGDDKVWAEGTHDGGKQKHGAICTNIASLSLPPGLTPGCFNRFPSAVVIHTTSTLADTLCLFAVNP
jgi:hypothetical protein